MPEHLTEEQQQASQLIEHTCAKYGCKFAFQGKDGYQCLQYGDPQDFLRIWRRDHQCCVAAKEGDSNEDEYRLMTSDGFASKEPAKTTL